MIWSYFLKRATLTTKGTESLELDERRGCLFQAGWKLTTDRKSYKIKVWTALLISRVLVSALTLSLKWLSNLSMGNRGFPPGLLADACKYILPALGRGYRHWSYTRTKNSLKPRYWIEEEARWNWAIPPSCPSFPVVDWFLFLLPYFRRKRSPGSTSTGDGDSFLKTVYSVES